MLLPKLYNKRSDGKLQEWNVEVDGDKYRTISGIVNGKQVISEWTVCTPKNVGQSNERDPIAQARLEAEAMWVKKCDKGYCETVAALESQDLFKPMLAKKYEDYVEDVAEAIAKGIAYSQPKLDGIRCNIVAGQALSREHNAFCTVSHIVERVNSWNMPMVIPDGELYADKFNNDFNAICSLVKRTKPTAEDLKCCSENIFHYLYDVYFKEEPKLLFSERYARLQELIKSKEMPEIKLVPTTKLESLEHMDELFEKYMDAGFEGQMIRIDHAYENKRSKYLLKRKTFIDEEYTIVGVKEGVGNRAGTAGSMIVKDAQGREFDAGIRGNRAYVKELLENKDLLVGKLATVKYFRLTPAGVPRFPVMKGIRDYE